MAKNLRISQTKDKLTIEIVPSIKPIAKFGLVFQGLLYFAIPIGSILWALNNTSDRGSKDGMFYIIISLMTSLYIVFIIAGWKYLRRAFHKEVLEVTQDIFTVKDQYLISKKERSFNIPEISNIRFAGQHDYTRHPLEGETIDFLGFGAEEREVQYMIEEGTIELFCNGGVRRFGKNLASWEAEKIISRLEEFTGNNLNLDDKMERLLDDLEGFSKSEDE